MNDDDLQEGLLEHTVAVKLQVTEMVAKLMARWELAAQQAGAISTTRDFATFDDESLATKFASRHGLHIFPVGRVKATFWRVSFPDVGD